MRGSRRRPVTLITGLLLLLLLTGCGGPWIRVQNVGNAPADVTVSYYDEQGNVVTQERQIIAPGASATFNQGSNDRLPRGYRGSALIESDQPIVALRRIDEKGSTAGMVDGETLSLAASGSNVYLPLVMHLADPFQSWSSRVNVQNLGDAPTCVRLTYVSARTGQVVASDPASGQPGCGQGGRQLAARATLFRDGSSFGVPVGFAGAVYVQALPHDQNSGSGTVSATVDNANNAFNLLSTYPGLTSPELGRTVLLPLVEREIGPAGSFSTFFSMMADSPTKSVTVQIQFEGVDANGVPVAKTGSVTFTGAKQCVQVANDSSNCLSAGDALPPGFSGWARLSASSPIGVNVQRGSYQFGFGNYAGASESNGATRIALPAVGHASWIRILAAGGSANVRIRYFGPDGERSTSVSVNRLATVFQGNEGLPPGFEGSAILESDRPIVAAVSYVAGGGDPDTGMLYNGVPIR